MPTIKVLLVEEDRHWRRRIFEELGVEPDIEVVEAVTTHEEAMREGTYGTIDVILMDVKLSGDKNEGVEVIKELIAARNDKPKIVMLSSITDRETIVRCFQNGAVNYLHKSNCRDMATAIRDAHHNRSAIHSGAADIIRDELKLMTLTPMEREVYRLKRSGYSKKQIAVRLFKSENTVKTQMRSIREKLAYLG